MESAMTASTAQTYARAAGILLVLTMIGGFTGELYLPSQLIVPGDAEATARNITASPFLHRLGFAMYLLEAACDITLSWVFYVLLRPVNREVALLAAFFGLVATSTFAMAEVFYFAPSFILGDPGYLSSFSSEQRNSLAMLSLRYYAYGSGVLMVFYGIAFAIRGYLISRSTYLPRFIGLLMMIAGAGFVIRNLLLVLVPHAASTLLLAPMFVAAISLMVWLLARGIDRSKWPEEPAVSALSR
jgi:hypothetical protein